MQPRTAFYKQNTSLFCMWFFIVNILVACQSLGHIEVGSVSYIQATNNASSTASSSQIVSQATATLPGSSCTTYPQPSNEAALATTEVGKYLELLQSNRFEEVKNLYSSYSLNFFKSFSVERKSSSVEVCQLTDFQSFSDNAIASFKINNDDEYFSFHYDDANGWKINAGGIIKADAYSQSTNLQPTRTFPTAAEQYPTQEAATRNSLYLNLKSTDLYVNRLVLHFSFKNRFDRCLIWPIQTTNLFFKSGETDTSVETNNWQSVPAGTDWDFDIIFNLSYSQVVNLMKNNGFNSIVIEGLKWGASNCQEAGNLLLTWKYSFFPNETH